MPLVHEEYAYRQLAQPIPERAETPIDRASERAELSIDLTLEKAKKLSEETMKDFDELLKAVKQRYSIYRPRCLCIELIPLIDKLEAKKSLFINDMNELNGQFVRLKESAEPGKIADLASAILRLREQQTQFKQLPRLKLRFS